MGIKIFDKICECGYHIRYEGFVPNKIKCSKCKKILKRDSNENKNKQAKND
jgi:hypothetical protein